MATKAFTIDKTNYNPPHNKNVIITGGSGGLGLATANLLTSNNNNVVSLDRNPPPSQASSSSPYSSPSSSPTCTSITHLPCDITSYPSHLRAFRTALTHFPTPTLDCIFINAGIAEHGNILFDDELAEPDRRTLDIDLRAVLDSLKLAIYHMRKDRRGQTGGSIVMTASLAGYLASAGASVYSAAKHGVVGFMRALKGDCAKLGIGISVVAPSIVLTEIVSGREKGEGLEEWGVRMRGLGVPISRAEEVAYVVVWLMGLGVGGGGKGILVQGGRCADVEGGIARSRGSWMGEEMLELFRRGRDAPLFPNKL